MTSKFEFRVLIYDPPISLGKGHIPRAILSKTTLLRLHQEKAMGYLSKGTLVSVVRAVVVLVLEHVFVVGGEVVAATTRFFACRGRDLDQISVAID